jgi:signal transduction histidine kinase
VTVRGPHGRLIRGLRHPKTTVRWRLTLLYGGLFLVSGAALLAITYTLVDHATVSNGPFRALVHAPGAGASVQTGGLGSKAPPNAIISRQLPREYQLGPSGARSAQLKGTARDLPAPLQELVKSQYGRTAILAAGSFQRVSDLHQLVIESSIALAVMAILSAALGWVVAGRVLRPLRTITLSAQHISAANLHERLALHGPPDELRRLADTIDELLGRLEQAFDAQRRFVANASHELRTPLTAVRALLEMVMTDPHATVESFRDTCAQVLQESEQQEQLIEALLALAQGQRGIDHPVPLDLATLAREVLDEHATEAAVHGVRIEASLEQAPIAGERRLIERLIANLVENALRHNVSNGTLSLSTSTAAGKATLSVSNTGPAVPAEEVDRLLQPFQRRATDRTGHREGLGLGLSIVAAIADAHGATLNVEPRPQGGLDVDIRFPLGDADLPAPSDPAQPRALEKSVPLRA